MPLPAPPNSSKATSCLLIGSAIGGTFSAPLIPKWWHPAESRSITHIKGRCAGTQWRARRSLWAAGEDDNAANDLA